MHMKILRSPNNEDGGTLQEGTLEPSEALADKPTSEAGETTTEEVGTETTTEDGEGTTKTVAAQEENHDPDQGEEVYDKNQWRKAKGLEPIVDDKKSKEGKEGKDKKPATKEGEGADNLSDKPEAGKDIKPGAATKPVPRPYDDIPADLQPIFKKMGNEQFAVAHKLLNENKELKAKVAQIAKQSEGALPESYYEHPEAFQLSPTYRNLTNAYATSNSLHEHWLRQRENIKKNGKVVPIITDEKTGKLSLGQEIEADDDLAVAVEKNITFTGAQATKYQERVESYKEQHLTIHQNTLKQVKEFEEAFYPGFDAEDHPTKALQKDIISKLPKWIQTNPLVSFLAKAAVHNQMLIAENKELKNAKAKVEAINKDIQQAPPTRGAFSGGGSGTKPSGNNGQSIRELMNAERNRE